MVVGGAVIGDLYQPFYWSPEAGLSTFEHVFRDGGRGQAVGVSDDGSVVAISHDDGDFLWSQEKGAVDLGKMLRENLGPRWSIFNLSALSADGRYAFAEGTSPTGDSVGLVIFVPEPSTRLFLSVGVVLTTLMTRRGRDSARLRRVTVRELQFHGDNANLGLCGDDSFHVPGIRNCQWQMILFQERLPHCRAAHFFRR